MVRLHSHELESVDFLQLGFDGLLSFPCYGTKAGMEGRLFQNENEIALAHRRAVESIRPIQTDVQPFGIALEFVTGQAVDLQPMRIIQPFLSG
jgi:hypothetical protein